MLDKLLSLFVLTLLPVFELRLTIPLGMTSRSLNFPFLGTLTGYDLPWQLVFLVCVASNALVSPILFIALERLQSFFLKGKAVKPIYERIVVRTQNKALPLVEKFGFWGLVIFVGIPLPATGAWAGTFAGFLFGMSFRKTVAANVLGVLIAGTIVTTLVLLGSAGMKFFGI